MLLFSAALPDFFCFSFVVDVVSSEVGGLCGCSWEERLCIFDDWRV